MLLLSNTFLRNVTFKFQLCYDLHNSQNVSLFECFLRSIIKFYFLTLIRLGRGSI